MIGFKGTAIPGSMAVMEGALMCWVATGPSFW